MSDLGSHQIVNYDGLAGIYRVDSRGHFPSGTGAIIATKRGDLEVGDTLVIGTHQDVNGRHYHLCSLYPLDPEIEEVWAFVLHRCGNSVVLAWYGESPNNFFGDDEEDAIFHPTYFLRFEAYGNPLRQLRIKAIRHDWMVENARNIEGVTTVEYRRNGSAYKMLNGSPVGLSRLLALAAEHPDDSMDEDYLLTVTRIRDLPQNRHHD